MTEKNNKYLIDETTISIEPILDNSDTIENITIDYIPENKIIDKSIELLSIEKIIDSKIEENINVKNIEPVLDNYTVNSIESILDKSDVLINETVNINKDTVNSVIETDISKILINDEKYVLKTDFIRDLDKLTELFDEKIMDLKKEFIDSNKSLYEKQKHIDILEDDLKNKEMLINDNTNIVNNLNQELEELKKKVKQQDIVKLLTKLKSDDTKSPIIIMENEDLDNKTNVVKFMDESKINLIKRRKKIF